ncbi:hypothetical protein AOQ84DRAFT_388383 [Glonium stellatum]|uniref:Uncharacterized protein n=1 Tax=Glonium stellatum TaxID=574774 RepID=A0A8E2F245_9PEZI|nr:hypothetical protein AOQ84DRAFT_388383 [Glonium stellatum]
MRMCGDRPDTAIEESEIEGIPSNLEAVMQNASSSTLPKEEAVLTNRSSLSGSEVDSDTESLNIMFKQEAILCLKEGSEADSGALIWGEESIKYLEEAFLPSSKSTSEASLIYVTAGQEVDHRSESSSLSGSEYLTADEGKSSDRSIKSKGSKSCENLVSSSGATRESYPNIVTPAEVRKQSGNDCQITLEKPIAKGSPPHKHIVTPNKGVSNDDSIPELPSRASTVPPAPLEEVAQKSKELPPVDSNQLTVDNLTHFSHPHSNRPSLIPVWHSRTSLSRERYTTVKTRTSSRPEFRSQPRAQKPTPGNPGKPFAKPVDSAGESPISNSNSASGTPKHENLSRPTTPNSQK